MSWSQDVIISVLFPFILPSLPVYKNECWSNKDMRQILEDLLMCLCNISMKRTQKLLAAFTRRMLSTSDNERYLNDELCFLADIEKRQSFYQFDLWRSDVYSRYACSFLIEHKANLHEKNDYVLRLASRKGYKDTVSLLLEHKAAIHVNDSALLLASEEGHKDIVALLIQHKADVRAENSFAFRKASEWGHKDVVTLLLEHKANVHAK
jgi:hypothetical protein